MADEQSEVKHVSWTDVFVFTRIFKSFQLALNWSNMGLALAAVILICLTGVVMDWVFAFCGQRVGVMEIPSYSSLSPAEFTRIKKTWETGRPDAVAGLYLRTKQEEGSLSRFLAGLTAGEHAHFQDAFRSVVQEENTQRDKDSAKATKETLDDLRKRAKEDWAKVLSEADDLEGMLAGRIDRTIDAAEDSAEKKIKEDSNLANKDKRSEAEKDLREQVAAARKALTGTNQKFQADREEIVGGKIWDSFIAYEGACAREAVIALVSGNITAALAEYRQKMPAPAAEAGFLVQVFRAIDGVRWLFCQHWLYAVLLTLFCLAIWAALGGAIYRVAAVQAARDEKISFTQALRFARSKFLSFFCAPLVPLAAIVAVGALLLAGGLLTNIPVIGPILVGLLFFLAVLLGLLIAFLAIGLVTGWALMFPTIAIEGSDSFDAMSRSFAYVFRRPWRAGLYGAVALVHGSICYLFVRFFAFVALAATHFFVKGSVWVGGDALPGLASADRVDVLWLTPTFRSLHEWNWEAMSGTECVAAVLVAVWVYVLIGLVAAFALSYFASSTTMIYYLLRKKVDATDLDEVYVEEEEEEPAAAPEQPAQEKPAEGAPAGEPEAKSGDEAKGDEGQNEPPQQ